MTFADKLRYNWYLLKTCRSRKRFFEENKGVKLPPPYYIYETFGLNYPEYYSRSLETAEWLVSYFRRYKELNNIKILDWGCGPGRIIRHLPGLVSDSCDLFGTDYNRQYIAWCEKNIPDVSFKINNLNPPLAFEDGFFDVIYGISIFTHLSEELCYKWFHELVRVTKPGGIIFLTLSGDVFKMKMTDAEKNQFDKGAMVVKAKTKEGHRTFAAFHPDSFVKTLAGDNPILEHEPGIMLNGKAQQDIWIIQKA